MRPRLLLLTLVCSALLAGCASTATGSKQAQPVAKKATSATTAAPRPTVDPSQIPASCNFGASLSKSLVRVGDVVATQANPFLPHPSYMLPDSTPLKPLEIGDPFKNPNPDAPLANPATHDGGGYLIQVCNISSSQSHTLRDISVHIDGFTAYSGQLNAWNGCDGAYEAQSKQVQGGGCGGALGPVDETLRANFAASDTSGASVTAAQISTGNSDPNGPPRAPLPVTLKPGESLVINLGIVVPTVPGTYTFTVGMGIDSTADDFYSTTTPALFAPVAHRWSGQACTSASALRQVPPPTDPIYYICPAS